MAIAVDVQVRVHVGVEIIGVEVREGVPHEVFVCVAIGVLVGCAVQVGVGVEVRVSAGKVPVGVNDIPDPTVKGAEPAIGK